MAQPRHRSARPEHGPGRDRQWQRKRHGMVRRECGAELEQTRPERHAASAAQREAGSEQCGASQCGSEQCGSIEAETNQHQNRNAARSAQCSAWSRRDRRGTAQSTHGSVRVRRGSSTDRHRLGAAQERTGTGGGAAWNGRRRLGIARSVVEMAQSATGSARHSRCGGAQTRGLPCHFAA